ncbi:serine/threonine-protein kinase PLK1 isoform X2 [Lingula anatina]|nr:serine/threonine-protein kinase PLK1 isoform X2 [Lingula anatina]XP_013406105.1 serine/threonine-protein kinase PLK1 isoform X2 [Lingula anatina]XP_013406113.1 serine/threonine-protein kinase PLK1 isoform X2 [Lingula anatina]XP_013406120.1 serine/threonine-protein kinase PLK1 isoform X2 [Lingula anatina]|eukprot:XP_013406101.1 serine/threonine-protein kinase PLK1 isoform X2 [Lingula anatina]
MQGLERASENQETGKGVLKMLTKATRAVTSHMKEMTSGKNHSKPDKQAVGLNNNMEPTHYIYDPGTQTTYLRGKLLGKGGFAKCYELTDLKTNKVYAGKIISKSRLTKPHQKEKIAREIELHRHLKHKHVVCFYNFFEDEENVYIILELCSRKSLVEVLKSRKTLTEPEVRYYLRHLVLGCQHIHGQKIVHRDLKLGNMLLNENMEIKIGDFGLATRIDFDGERKTTVCGTPNYIAPEVLQKTGHSYEADVWAIGCVLYALLVGRPPFETATLKETYMRITSNKYNVPAHISNEARNLIRKCLNPHPDQRPTLDQIMQDEFLVYGYIPKVLSGACCTCAPKFPVIETLSSSRPKSYAVPVSNHEAVQKITSSLAQLKNHSSKLLSPGLSRKSPKPLAQGTVREKDNERLTLSPVTAQTLAPPVIAGGFHPVICPDRSQSPKPGSAANLLSHLETCLRASKTVSSLAPGSTNANILWVTKWVDYSNKYGFGFQLSNKMVGVLFNDMSRMALSSDGREINYFDVTDKMSTFATENIPPSLQKRVQLLLYFGAYMDEHLIRGGDIQGPRHAGCEPVYMKKWFRTSKAIVMYLSNRTLQINFFDDHTKIILCYQPEIVDTTYLVTYINQDRVATTYFLSQLTSYGCPSVVHDRLLYAKNMLQNMIDIDGDDI